MSKFGDNVVARKHKKLGEFTAIAVLCDESNNKWWRIRHDGNTIDLGIKTFSNIDKIRFDDGEFYEIQDLKECSNCTHHDARDNYCVLLNVYGLTYCSKWEEE